MSVAVILDPAHGKDTKGKRSPDGNHREYLWSRERIAKIASNVLRSSHFFELYFPFLSEENEPGLTNRVLKYNDISKGHDSTFILSIHNDAYGDGSKWTKPRGVSVWTSKGETRSDRYATGLFNFLQHKYPNEKFRSAMWLGQDEKHKDPDWEANFTILAGNSKVKPLYDAVLLEWLFQTNKQDMEKLSNYAHNLYFEDMITEWLLQAFNKYE